MASIEREFFEQELALKQAEIDRLTKQNDLLIIQMRAIASAPIGLGAAGGHGMAKWALQQVGDTTEV